MTSVQSLVGGAGGGIAKAAVGEDTKKYEEYFTQDDSTARNANYTDVVNKYYDLATTFYEYGW